MLVKIYARNWTKGMGQELKTAILPVETGNSIQKIISGVSSLVFLADDTSVHSIREILTIIKSDKAKNKEMVELFGCSANKALKFLDEGMLDEARLDLDVLETIEEIPSMNIFN